MVGLDLISTTENSIDIFSKNLGNPFFSHFCEVENVVIEGRTVRINKNPFEADIADRDVKGFFSTE